MTLCDGKTEITAKIILTRHTFFKGCRLLVVGCGSGMEAAILAQELNTEVVGIDKLGCFNKQALKHKRLILKRGDAIKLEFPDQSFDFVYSYHTIEHIPDYCSALLEIKRVLRNKGGYFIGTPNRLRLIGYLGSKKETTWKQKIKYNIYDWKDMLKGKFKNEYGAHAGFSSEDLKKELTSFFSNVTEITMDYYLAVYTKYSYLIHQIDKINIGKYLFPSVYFMGYR